MSQQDHLWHCVRCREPLGRVINNKLRLGGTAIATIEADRGGTVEVRCRCGEVKQWLPRGTVQRTSMVS